MRGSAFRRVPLAMLLVASDLSKSHGLRELFHGVSISVADGDRVGFIGPNGAGKSTLLRMLAGAEEPDEGIVRTQRGAVIVYVPQRDDFDDGLTPRMAATAAAMKAASVHSDHHEAEVLGSMILGKLGLMGIRFSGVAGARPRQVRKKFRCILANDHLSFLRSAA